MAHNVAAEYAAPRLHVFALGGECIKIAISIYATSRAPALKSCIAAAPPMNFHRTFACPCWGHFYTRLMSKTQDVTEIIRLQAGIPKARSLKIVCCQYLRLWIMATRP